MRWNARFECSADVRRFRIIWLLWIVALPLSAQTYEWPDDSICSIAFWNVENLFHPGQDSLNQDFEFTPDGSHRWTKSRYFRKLEKVSRALTLIGGWQGLDIIGLSEVENDSCLIHLTRRLPGYEYVHYDSPDRRGIDCALLFRSNRINVLHSQPILIQPDSLTRTRDILYVCARTFTGDTLHLFVCHLPSQRGGQSASEWKRQYAKQILQTRIDSLYAVHPEPTIVVMGDMNCAPHDDLERLTNLAAQKATAKRWEGTHKFQGRWTMLDQFYVSDDIARRAEMSVMDIDMLKEPDIRYLGYKPRRTYVGPRYCGGVSDHYPVLLRLKSKH